MRAAFGAGDRRLSFHCMSAVGAPTHADPGQPRADFNIGDIHGTTCTPELFDFIAGTLQDRGHSVSRNFPYYGGELTRRHSNLGEPHRQRVHRDQQAACSSTPRRSRRPRASPRSKASVEALIRAVVAYSTASCRLLPVRPRARDGPLRSCPPPSTKQARRSSPPLLRYGGRPMPEAFAQQRRRSDAAVAGSGRWAPCGAEVLGGEAEASASDSGDMERSRAPAAPIPSGGDCDEVGFPLK